MINLLKAIWAFITKDEVVPTIPVVTVTVEPAYKPVVEEPIVAPVVMIEEIPKYLWDTRGNVRHSIRVICDEEGLSVSDKNDLCATIYCESAGFNTKAINENKVNGKVVSTDWGLCQWNDHYHGVEIPPEVALNDPEKAVRLMCKYWKSGQKRQWVCYSKGLYQQYLNK